MNPQLQHIKQSPTVSTADKARALEQQGIEVVKLTTGDPDFATPAPIVEAALAAMNDGLTHYSASRGLPELRQAIAEKLRRDNNLDYDPATEILITHGASHAIFAALQTILTPGDEVLMITPCWMTYTNSILLAGAKPVQVPTDPSRGFRFDLDRLKASITARSRVILLNSPTNPTGNVLTREDITAIAELAEQHDLYVLADEVYEKLIYDGREHVSIGSLPGMKPRTITVNSFSKTFAMTGWRVGYIAAPAELVGQALKITQAAGTHAATFSQRAAWVGLTDPSIPAQVEEMRQTYDQRRKRAIEVVEEIPGLGYARPEGAFYLMLDISNFSQDSVAFSDHMLDKARVCMVPGTGFGDAGQGWLRMTYAADEATIIDGLMRMAEFIRAEYA
jgi:aspartate aminotransferase